MFSSLLPRPKHSSYKAPNSGTNQLRIGPDSQILAISSNSSQTQVVTNPAKGATIAQLHLDADGNVDYASTIASAASDGVSKVQATYEDTIPLKTRIPNLKHHFPRYDLDTCPDDSLKECVEETRAVINRILNDKIGISSEKKNTDGVTFVKYQSNSIVDSNHNVDIVRENEGNESSENGNRERVIQIREYKEDPMLPPKFKLRKNRHKNPSPPPPILKDTSGTEAKLTKEDREKWRIPAAVSNWKNNQGFTISLDKRMKAASGGSLDEGAADVNIEKFGSLSSALEQADKQAREDIKIRNEMLKQRAITEQKEKEAKLKELAALSKNERYSTKRGYHPDQKPTKKRDIGYSH
ncbi:component of the spliceosome [Scheffersomyces stipitis CBS 6054]|uniref:Pre-mRNA-processing protein 45 n=1 Tax=Scheffersomyces stipitis (strain ATCC 58785 / CBS 6054 / NBRC 10063 / NRRL Y-11545) TaxID=322104 RepID=A3LT86_PICST|nr:component of the spliceosome [Scheffersomyces stipitis CBS 6054]ABN66029.2 component of the spliceosome [Scheffersomyces stipitis CBS 6054]